MEEFDRKSHWEKIYTTKELTEVSWYQSTPKTSLEFFAKYNVPYDAKVIDVGGGDSFLVDHLLDLGYSDITVLDISESAIERAKKRLGDRSSLVKWVVADIAQFNPTEQYDIWHDRAAFHFLTDPKEIASYVSTLNQAINSNGVLVLGTFSTSGPLKCSGIEITQYDEAKMEQTLETTFEKIECFNVDHPTPFETTQNFIFCSFRKVN